MTKYYNNTHYSGLNESKRRRNPWITALIVTGIVIGSLVVIAACVLWGFAIYYKPDRIISMIEEKSSEYLNAEVSIGNLDYKIRGYYPWVYFEVDSVTITSKSLDGISPEIRNRLPVNSEELASVEKISGRINVHSLIKKKIDLKEIEIIRPEVNIVEASEGATNFNILKEKSGSAEMPDFQIGTLNITGPIILDYFSLPKDAQADLNIREFILKSEETDLYHITFDGTAAATYKGRSLPGRIPLKFSTALKLHPDDLLLKLQNLKLALAGVGVEARGEIAVTSEKIDFQDADFHFMIDDIFTLLNYLPEGLQHFLPIPEGLTGKLPLSIFSKLERPYSISLKDVLEKDFPPLPYLTVNVKTENANLDFKPPHGKQICADDIYLEAECSVNPENPDMTFLYIKTMRMNGEGIDLSGTINITGFLAENQHIEGDLRLKTPLMETLSYLMPRNSFKLKGFLNGEIEFSANSQNYGKDGIKDIDLKGSLNSHDLYYSSASSGNLQLRNVSGKYAARIPEYPLNSYAGMGLDIEFKADSISLLNKNEKIYLTDLVFDLDALDTLSGQNPDPFGTISVNLKNVRFTDGATKLYASDIGLKANGSMGASQINVSADQPDLTGNEALIEARVHHTPITLEYEGGGMLQTLMTLVTLYTDVTVGSGRFETPQYLYPAEFNGVKVSTDLNNYKFTASEIKIYDTSFSISGEFNGLQPFMTSYSPTPLKTTADIKFRNVDINSLAYGYYGALIKQGVDSVYYVAPMTPYTAADSICVLIPRNIDANISLRADAAEYMGYKFSPLSTAIIVKNGDATLKNLSIGTPYCSVDVDWTYSTSHLDNIFMDLKAHLKNFNFSDFYNSFPNLIAKTPELKNFTGNLWADISCNFEMFPSMFMNFPSLKSKFDIRANNLEFARTGKIEKITHLMLIEGDKPISIENINITGGFHDKLLQVNPFKIKFDDYQLALAGVNNVAGDMYYHCALEKSPFHLPFGVSFTGNFKYPEIKLGGTHINDYKSETISSDLEKNIDVNIMTWLHHGWLLFVQEAAKYQGGLSK